jgi:hypothetical protein
VRATVGGKFLTVMAFMLHLASLCIAEMHVAIPQVAPRRRGRQSGSG